MTDGQRAEELEYFCDLMVRCSSSIEANLSRRDREGAEMWYRTARCITMLLQEVERLKRTVERTDDIRPYGGEGVIVDDMQGL